MANEFFRIEMLPARHGDCLWIEYGRGRKTNRILIDGGPVDTYDALAQRIAAVPRGQRTLELVMLTHVDADHVEGLVRFFADKPPKMTVRKVWFNGWRQMNAAHGLLGAKQGEFLSALLAKRARRAWAARGKPLVVPETGKLPKFKLEGGLVLTLLSPSAAKLDRMAKQWKKAVVAAGIAPGDLEAAWTQLAKTKKFVPKQGLLGAAPKLDVLVRKQFVSDQAVPNGSSIAVLAEYGGKRALLLGDAHPQVVASSLERLCAERGVRRLEVDAVKVAHHGSAKNTSAALLKLISCPRWLISTNGDQFEHPDEECVARILEYAKPKQLCFNYRTKFTRTWLSKAAQRKHRYEAVVRGDDELSLVVEL